MKKEIKVTVNDKEYTPCWEYSGAEPTDLEMRSDLLYDLGFKREPEDKSLVVDTSDQADWIPMRYVGPLRFNIYDAIKEGKITKKNGYTNVYNIGVDPWIRNYISDNFEEYAKIAGVKLDKPEVEETIHTTEPTKAETVTEPVTCESNPQTSNVVVDDNPLIAALNEKSDAGIANIMYNMIKDPKASKGLVDVLKTFAGSMRGFVSPELQGQLDKAVKFMNDEKALAEVKAKLEEYVGEPKAVASINHLDNGNIRNTIPYIPEGGFKEVETPSGFTKTEDGEIEVDLSKVVNTPEQAGNYDPSNPVISMLGTPVVQQAEVVTNTPVNPQPMKTVQPEVRIKKDKGDLVDGSPKPTVVSPMEVDASKELFDKYPCLGVIDKGIGPQFIKRYSNMDNHMMKVEVYDNSDTELQNPIDSMGMVIDVVGSVYQNDPKFWMTKSISADSPVDFIKPMKITEDSVHRALADETVEDDYLANDNGMALNKILNVRSLQEFIKDHDTQINVMRKIEAAFKNNTLKGKLGSGRMIMTDFKDENNFVLETLDNVPKYMGGPKANKTHITFTCKGGKITSKIN